MCGIAGFTGKQNDKLLHQMSEDMKHRGPDGEGFFIYDDISLLNRRLAIIDRKGGDQPIYNEDKSIVVVYNGEIYNYLQLKDELEKAGHTFKTKSDTEVIVHGYEEWGEESFDRLNGMFGIALYDLKKKKLLLVRDHFGIKPVYFVRPEYASDRYIFSSELKPIIYSGLIEKKVNERILYRYLQFRIHDDHRETFFKGIERLLPGELAVIDAKGIEIKEYSTLKKDLESLANKSSNSDLSETEIKKFKDELINSVKSRLVSEVPVGTALSGGLDSSSVVAIINQLQNEKAKETISVGANQNTFSAVFPGSSNDEERYIDDLLAEKKNIESHKVYPKPEEFFKDIEDFVKTQEEPTISTGPYAQYQVMKEAHKHVTVLLDGQGADEMMAGYLPYYFVYLRELKNSGDYSAFFKELYNSKDVLFKYGSFKAKALLKPKSIGIASLLHQTFANKFLNEKFRPNGVSIKKRLIEDIFSNSLPSLLRYEDRNTMRFSIEGRVPFLDFNLIRYLFSLSDQAILKDGWNKYILRQAVTDLLPASITKRRNKIGFTTPEHEWFLRMKNRIYGIFLSESFAGRPYFNQSEVLKAFQQFIEGKTDDTMLFWRILNVELWLRIFFDEKTETVQKERGHFDANENKKINIEVDKKVYSRYPIHTELVNKDTNISSFVAEYVSAFLKRFEKEKNKIDSKWYVIISEKIVAISQGRSYFLWDIKPSWWATMLSKFVKRTPYGIGLGSPWTMQIAIEEIGLPRVLAASIVSAMTKPFGVKGLFYKIVGPEIAAIDGPTEYSVYPSNVSAKLAPKDPLDSAKSIGQEIYKSLDKRLQTLFGGVVIIDANDLGRNVLGNATADSDILFEKIMGDNPMGQGSEQTPIVVVI